MYVSQRVVNVQVTYMLDTMAQAMSSESNSDRQNFIRRDNSSAFIDKNIIKASVNV